MGMNQERILFSSHYLELYSSPHVGRYSKYRDRSATTLDASLRRWRKSLAGYTRWPFMKENGALH